MMITYKLHYQQEQVNVVEYNMNDLANSVREGLLGQPGIINGGTHNVEYKIVVTLKDEIENMVSSLSIGLLQESVDGLTKANHEKNRLTSW